MIIPSDWRSIRVSPQTCSLVTGVIPIPTIPLLGNVLLCACAMATNEKHPANRLITLPVMLFDN